MIDDDVEQLICGEMLIQDLARTAKLRTRAGKWQTHLDVLLAKSGGVAGEHTLGGRPRIVTPPKAVLGAALREQREALGSRRVPKASASKA
jgi:hypothetical protein